MLNNAGTSRISTLAFLYGEVATCLNTVGTHFEHEFFNRELLKDESLENRPQFSYCFSLQLV